MFRSVKVGVSNPLTQAKSLSAALRKHRDGRGAVTKWEEGLRQVGVDGLSEHRKVSLQNRDLMTKLQ